MGFISHRASVKPGRPEGSGNLIQRCDFNILLQGFSLLTALGWLQAHIWFSYENIRWEGRRKKKEGTQHNLIWTLCGLIFLVLSFLHSSFPECFVFARDLVGIERKRGPLNVQECTFAKHHTRAQTRYGREGTTHFTELRLAWNELFVVFQPRWS